MRENGFNKEKWLYECYRSNQAVTCICHVVDVCSNLHKDFHDYCLFNTSDQIVVGLVFSCFRLKNYKKIVLRRSVTINTTVASKRHSTNKKCFERTATESAKLYDTRTNLWKLTDKLCFQVFCGFVYKKIMEFEYNQAYKMIETRVLFWKSKNMKPYHAFPLLW